MKVRSHHVNGFSPHELLRRVSIFPKVSSMKRLWTPAYVINPPNFKIRAVWWVWIICISYLNSLYAILIKLVNVGHGWEVCTVLKNSWKFLPVFINSTPTHYKDIWRCTNPSNNLWLTAAMFWLLELLSCTGAAEPVELNKQTVLFVGSQ